MLPDLQALVSRYPSLLKMGNRNSDELAIFYSVRNRQLETTIYLLDMGQTMDLPMIHRSVYNSKTPNLTYQFFMELDKIRPFSKIDGQDFENWLFIRCKAQAFLSDNLIAIENLIELKGIKDWGQILTEYRKERISSPKAKQVIRDITLKYLLDEL